MSPIKQLDHVGVTVADLDAAAARRGTGVELATFVRPEHQPGSPDAMATELGLRNIGYEVEGLLAMIDGLAARGYGLVGEIGRYEDMWLMAHVRGPEGIVVSLSERIG